MAEKKKVLLYLGKFPGYGFDIDGGSILARQLIDTLKENCILDLVFIRKNKEIYEDSSVNSIRYVEYKDAFNNKFIRRLKNLDTNIEAIGDYSKYDIIITAHISKFFGFPATQKDFWEKTILFPMFCTSSYQRAGEIVPEEYTALEKIVASNVKKIITPSIEEKNDLINDYLCDNKKIKVIYRGINPAFTPKEIIDLKEKINVVCVGSIKPQKNSLDLIRLIERLNSNKSNKFYLHLVCTIQNKELYEQMLSYIKSNKLDDYVTFHIEVPQDELAVLLKSMDINVSMSNWETFGRGIFEGIASGLPTFINSKLKVIKEICGSNSGVTFSDSFEEMADSILNVCSNIELYREIQRKQHKIINKVAYQTEKENLISEILK